MKLPIDQRSALANEVLTLMWPVSYWSRDEQLFACAEGWSLCVFAEIVGDNRAQDRIARWDIKDGQATDFKTDAEAVAYVLQRASEGSPLHARALVLHSASVLKHG